jgi:hypothetical protein
MDVADACARHVPLASRRRGAVSARCGPARARRAAAQVPQGPRLCAAIVDRLTFAGQIIETGTTSYRLAHARQRRAEGRDRK